MATDLADYIEGTPGRFVPDEMRGELVEAEHVARYRWAAALAPGRRVLDAGCGMAYGSAMLGQAGATSVVGVDVAEPVLDAARPAMPAGVELARGDVRELPFGDGEFDLVVCFEVIEHIEQQERAFAEFRRVLAADGLLVVSSPNRDVYVPGNPHHAHELTPAELEQAVADRFRHCRLVRQHTFALSAVLADTSLATADGAPLSDVRVHKLGAVEPGSETYTVAIAGDGDLPAVPDLCMVASPVEIREWVDRFADQQAQLERLTAALDDADRRREEHAALLARLAEVEGSLEELPVVRRRLALAEAELHEVRRELTERLQAESLARQRVEGSRSWQLTQPLRRAGGILRMLRGRNR